ncbi:MAG: hypothetical protein U0527_13845 [Candidatus Eisenbacteria bacterium]
MRAIGRLQARQAGDQLVSLKRLAPAVLLDHPLKDASLDVLLGGEAMVAGIALAPTTNRLAIVHRARFEHAIFIMATARTAQANPVQGAGVAPAPLCEDARDQRRIAIAQLLVSASFSGFALMRLETLHVAATPAEKAT